MIFWLQFDLTKYASKCLWSIVNYTELWNGIFRFLYILKIFVNFNFDLEFLWQFLIKPILLMHLGCIWEYKPNEVLFIDQGQLRLAWAHKGEQYCVRKVWPAHLSIKRTVNTQSGPYPWQLTLKTLPLVWNINWVYKAIARLKDFFKLLITFHSDFLLYSGKKLQLLKKYKCVHVRVYIYI